MSARPADYDVSALDKRTDEKATVGRAWKNEDGTIGIVLDSFVRLEGSRHLLVTLFPADGSHRTHRQRRDTGLDDDIPFCGPL